MTVKKPSGFSTKSGEKPVDKLVIFRLIPRCSRGCAQRPIFAQTQLGAVKKALAAIYHR
jgi:hypothetical protein